MVFKLVLDGSAFWIIVTPVLWLSYSPGKLLFLGKLRAVWKIQRLSQAQIDHLSSHMIVIVYFCNCYNFLRTKQRNLKFCWFCFKRVRLKNMEILQDIHE